MIMNLRLFDDPAPTYTVTVYKDSGLSAASASPNTGVAKDTEVTLSVTKKTGKDIDKYIVLAGGVTVDPDTKKFTMGEANVVIYVTSKTKGSDGKWPSKVTLYKGECIRRVDIAGAGLELTNEIVQGYVINPEIEDGYVLDSIICLSRNSEYRPEWQTENENAGYFYTKPKNDEAVYLVTAKQDGVTGKRYRVTEPCVVKINGKETMLVPNVKVYHAKNGTVASAGVFDGGVRMAENDAVKQLVAQGVLEEL